MHKQTGNFSKLNNKTSKYRALREEEMLIWGGGVGGRVGVLEKVTSKLRPEDEFFFLILRELLKGLYYVFMYVHLHTPTHCLS